MESELITGFAILPQVVLEGVSYRFTGCSYRFPEAFRNQDPSKEVGVKGSLVRRYITSDFLLSFTKRVITGRWKKLHGWTCDS